jgi:hypothetical protein
MIRSSLLLASVVIATTTAHADICSTLQRQYAAVGSAPNAGANLASLSRSLEAAEAAAQANRCYGGFFGLFGGGPSASCHSILAEVNRLQSAVHQAAARSRAASAAAVSREQIRKSMAANGCSSPGSAIRSASQMLCVRTCDGYYFPIRSEASSNRSQVGAQLCDAMYGGKGKAQLFLVARNGDVADATPVGGGKAYSAQPYAFAYRKSYDRACAGQLQSGIAALVSAATRTVVRTALAVKQSASAAKETTVPVPLPQPRPPRFEDPETLANAMGGIAPNDPRAGSSGDDVRVILVDGYNQTAEEGELAGVSWWGR